MSGAISAKHEHRPAPVPQSPKIPETHAASSEGGFGALGFGATNPAASSQDTAVKIFGDYRIWFDTFSGAKTHICSEIETYKNDIKVSSNDFNVLKRHLNVCFKMINKYYVMHEFGFGSVVVQAHDLPKYGLASEVFESFSYVKECLKSDTLWMKLIKNINFKNKRKESTCDDIVFIPDNQPDQENTIPRDVFDKMGYLIVITSSIIQAYDTEIETVKDSIPDLVDRLKTMIFKSAINFENQIDAKNQSSKLFMHEIRSYAIDLRCNMKPYTVDEINIVDLRYNMECVKKIISAILNFLTHIHDMFCKRDTKPFPCSSKKYLLHIDQYLTNCAAIGEISLQSDLDSHTMQMIFSDVSKSFTDSITEGEKVEEPTSKRAKVSVRKVVKNI
jgi:uncharacterized spore protein YtfJ